MLGFGTATLEFREPDLAAPLPAPATTALIAGALLAGFKLVPSPEVNHEDILIHPHARRLQHFRDLSRVGMERVIRFHFLHGQRILIRLGERRESDAVGVRRFAERWQSDPAFHHCWESHPRFATFHDTLRAKLLKNGRRTILATEGKRIVLARTPNFGGDADTARAFAEMMEQGSIV